ncbi:MAG: LysR family transcriptional regulator [Magnetospirillum sp.]|nr:LysR family transcriptional regulator [Magnetospirillum sp.]
MQRTNINDIIAFLAVARERSFTKAAAKLGVSQSALSHTVRGLEEKLGLRLLTRTTRSVSPTEAGERLLHSVGPRLDEIDAEMAALTALRDKPAGNIRITAGDHAVQTVLWPVMQRILADYPDISIEVLTDSALRDIVAERLDAGIRLGESLDKDMIALPVSGDLRLVVVGAPSYFASRPRPEAPNDLTDHNCINIRMQTYGGLYAWEFEKDGRALRVRVDGQLTFNNTGSILNACLAGFGLAYLMEDTVADHVAAGRLVKVLEDWSPPFAGYYLYYPSRRQPTPAFSVLINALRRNATITIG